MLFSPLLVSTCLLMYIELGVKFSLSHNVRTLTYYNNKYEKKLYIFLIFFKNSQTP